MELNVVFVLVSFIILCDSARIRDLPPYITKCRRSDPKINECLMRGAEQIRPYLKKGIPELGVPSFEPYIIPEVSLRQGTDKLNFVANLTNVAVHGLTNYRVSRIEFDVPNLHWIVEGEVGPLILEGFFDIVGRILFVPINGNGTFTSSIENSKVSGFQSARIIKKRGMDFLDLIYANSTIKATNPKLNFKGKFDGDEKINELATMVINENADVLFEDMRPVLQDVIVQISQSLMKNLCSYIPYDKLYPQ